MWFEFIISIKPYKHFISFHVSFWASSKLILTFTKWGGVAGETTSGYCPQCNFRQRNTTSVHGRQLPSTSASPQYFIQCFQHEWAKNVSVQFPFLDLQYILLSLGVDSHKGQIKMHNLKLRFGDIWKISVKILVNIKKTSCIIFKLRQKKLGKSFTLCFGNQTLKQVNETKFLDVYIAKYYLSSKTSLTL